MSVEMLAPNLLDVKRPMSLSPFVAEGSNAIDVGASPADHLSLFIDGGAPGNRLRLIAEISAVQHNTTGGSSYFDWDVAGSMIPGLATGDATLDVCRNFFLSNCNLECHFGSTCG